jgi:DNA replication protein DnaC
MSKAKKAITELKKFEPCRICINKNSPKDLPGFYYIGEGLNRQIKECTCHKKWIRDTLVKVKVREAKLESDPEDSELMTYDPLKHYVGTESLVSVKKLTFIKDNFKNLFIHTPIYIVGEYRTQKTHLAKWLGISLIKKGYSAYYINMQDIVKALDLRFSEEKTAQNEEFIEKLLSVDFLIIDESFYKIKVRMYVSGIQFPALDSFLRERIDQRRKSTCFVSNIAPDGIEKEGFSDSIQDYVARKIRENNTELIFKDNYDKVKNKFATFDVVNK